MFCLILFSGSFPRTFWRFSDVCVLCFQIDVHRSRSSAVIFPSFDWYKSTWVQGHVFVMLKRGLVRVPHRVPTRTLPCFPHDSTYTLWFHRKLVSSFGSRATFCLKVVDRQSISSGWVPELDHGTLNSKLMVSCRFSLEQMNSVSLDVSLVGRWTSYPAHKNIRRCLKSVLPWLDNPWRILINWVRNWVCTPLYRHAGSWTSKRDKPWNHGPIEPPRSGNRGNIWILNTS